MDTNCCVDTNKIKLTSIEKKLSRKQLSVICGIEETTLWRIEALPSYGTRICLLIKIAEALEVPLSSFLLDDKTTE